MYREDGAKSYRRYININNVIQIFYMYLGTYITFSSVLGSVIILTELLHLLFFVKQNVLFTAFW